MYVVLILSSLANVLLQSGSTVPEWMLKLPKPSKMKRREMGKVNRGEAVTKAGRIGRSQALKRKCVCSILALMTVHIISLMVVTQPND